jgi:hypothetical protein
LADERAAGFARERDAVDTARAAGCAIRPTSSLEKLRFTRAFSSSWRRISSVDEAISV